MQRKGPGRTPAERQRLLEQIQAREGKRHARTGAASNRNLNPFSPEVRRLVGVFQERIPTATNIDNLRAESMAHIDYVPRAEGLKTARMIECTPDLGVLPLSALRATADGKIVTRRHNEVAFEHAPLRLAARLMLPKVNGGFAYKLCFVEKEKLPE